MKKYAVFLAASVSVEVEADTPEEAIEKAGEVNLFVKDDRIDVIFVEKDEVRELDEHGNILP